MDVNLRPKSACQTLYLMSAYVDGVPDDRNLQMIYQVCIIDKHCICNGNDTIVTKLPFNGSSIQWMDFSSQLTVLLRLKHEKKLH